MAGAGRRTDASCGHSRRGMVRASRSIDSLVDVTSYVRGISPRATAFVATMRAPLALVGSAALLACAVGPRGTAKTSMPAATSTTTRASDPAKLPVGIAPEPASIQEPAEPVDAAAQRLAEVTPTVTALRQRAAEVVEGELLRLRAEMKLPGRAWLDLGITTDDAGGTRFHQRAVFAPRGVLGRAYWASVYPFHDVVFGGMQRNIAAQAAALAKDRVTAAVPDVGAPLS